jgi:hypothetical protein
VDTILSLREEQISWPRGNRITVVQNRFLGPEEQKEQIPWPSGNRIQVVQNRFLGPEEEQKEQIPWPRGNRIQVVQNRFLGPEEEQIPWPRRRTEFRSTRTDSLAQWEQDSGPPDSNKF